VALTGCVHLAESSSRTHIRRALETSATKEALLAASALLRSYCDVIVEVDEEGLVASPCPALSSFLLHGTDRNLQGLRFDELLLHEEDKQLFLSMLQMSSLSNTGMAEAIHVRVRDGNGNILHLELLCFQFRHLDDQLRYMVGLREFSDASGSCDQCRANDLVTTNCEGSASPQATCDLEAVAVVDCRTEALMIKSVSSEFRMRIGRVPPQTRFGDIVTNGAKFRMWVQRSLNMLAYEGEQLPDCHVTFCMPQGRMDATCKILPRQRGEESGDGGAGVQLDDSNEEDDDSMADIEHVRLAFYNITPQHKRFRCVPENWRGTPVARMVL